MKVEDWVCCQDGSGHRHENGSVSTQRRHFQESSVGMLKALNGDTATVWLIGKNETWDVAASSLAVVDVSKTGDNYDDKICNKCHRLLPVNSFAKNQSNKITKVLRRPSCLDCRTDIDKRPPKTKQAREAEKQRPKRGTAFRCPICDKRSIVGVTAKIVADHNHHTGNIRDFICDSCNTGLGRFKNGKNCLKNAMEYLAERDK